MERWLSRQSICYTSIGIWTWTPCPHIKSLAGWNMPITPVVLGGAEKGGSLEFIVLAYQVTLDIKRYHKK